MTDAVPIPADLFARVASFGVDVPAVLARAGVSPTQTAFSTSEQMAFWGALAELTPDRAIGLRLGRDKTPAQLNLAELAAIHAPTFDEGLQRLARYKRIVCAEDVIVARRGDEVRIGFEWIHARGPVPHLLIECVFAAVIKLVENASHQRLVPRRLELSRRRDRSAGLLKAHFGCSVVFDAPHDRIVVAVADLARRFRPQDAARYARLLPSLETSAAARALSFVDEVRRALRNHMVGEQITLARVARDLGRTPRTLQRHLVRDGTSYQALLDDVRRSMSRRLLAATDLAESEVAFLLGFAELNSFTRAFRGWEGTSPRRWRQRA